MCPLTRGLSQKLGKQFGNLSSYAEFEFGRVTILRAAGLQEYLNGQECFQLIWSIVKVLLYYSI